MQQGPSSNCSNDINELDAHIRHVRGTTMVKTQNLNEQFLGSLDLQEILGINRLGLLSVQETFILSHVGLAGRLGPSLGSRKTWKDRAWACA